MTDKPQLTQRLVSAMAAIRAAASGALNRRNADAEELREVLRSVVATTVQSFNAPGSIDDALDMYVPATWRCVKCGFSLSRATINAATGGVGVTVQQVLESGEQCPNDGAPLVRVLWREQAEEDAAWRVEMINTLCAMTKSESLPESLGKIESLQHVEAASELTTDEQWLWNQIKKIPPTKAEWVLFRQAILSYKRRRIRSARAPE